MLYVQSFFFSLHFYLVVHFEMNEKKKKQQTRDKSKQKRTHNHTHMCGVWRNIHLRFPLEWFFYMRYMNWSGRDHKSTDLELTYCIVSIVSCGRCRRVIAVVVVKHSIQCKREMIIALFVIVYWINENVAWLIIWQKSAQWLNGCKSV